MPKVSAIVENSEHTWGANIDKKDAPRSFWLHGSRLSTTEDEDSGNTVELIVFNCTANGDASLEDDRFVIVLGDTPERHKLHDHFATTTDTKNAEPIGPCALIEVALKGGRTFWRLEDAE